MCRVQVQRRRSWAERGAGCDRGRSAGRAGRGQSEHDRHVRHDLAIARTHGRGRGHLPRNFSCSSHRCNIRATDVGLLRTGSRPRVSRPGWRLGHILSVLRALPRHAQLPWRHFPHRRRPAVSARLLPVHAMLGAALVKMLGADWQERLAVPAPSWQRRLCCDRRRRRETSG
eukprot:3568595-Rhodomonas_salina.1